MQIPASPSSSGSLPAFEERFGIEGLTDVHTALVTLSPAFVDALKQIAPKKRRSKLPLVLLLGIAAIVFALGMDKSTREFVTAKAHAIAARGHAPEAAPPIDSARDTVVVAVPTVQRPPSVLVDDPPPPPPSTDVRKAGKKPSQKATKKLGPGAGSPKTAAGLVAVQRTKTSVGS